MKNEELSRYRVNIVARKVMDMNGAKDLGVEMDGQHLLAKKLKEKVNRELRRSSGNIEAKVGKWSKEKVRAQPQLQSTNACTCAAREDISIKHGTEKTMLARGKGPDHDREGPVFQGEVHDRGR